VSMAEAGAGRVVLEWLMKGTNTGAFQGLPPTGRSISLAGVDVIEIGADGIKSVKGYFDTRAVPEQLGLQVLVQPFQLGPFSFGSSTAVQSGKKTKPGAFGITTIWNTDGQTEEVRAFTRATATEMLRMEGFIGVSVFRIGNRGVTISAWEKPEHVKQLMRDGAHSEAMQKFWAELGDSAFTSVWVPARVNPMWVRCTACRKMNDYEKTSGVCRCGQKLPEAPSYF
jgi:heme-degrading monooxygenase HmoA